jgi:hypothetical protein
MSPRHEKQRPQPSDEDHLQPADGDHPQPIDDDRTRPAEEDHAQVYEKDRARPSEADHAEASEEDYVQASEDLDLAFPESAEALVPAGSSPLSPKEAEALLRDEKISAALRYIIFEERPSEDEEPDPVPANPVRASHAHSPPAQTAPWFWPLIAATLATCIMLTMLFVILFVL